VNLGRQAREEKFNKFVYDTWLEKSFLEEEEERSSPEKTKVHE
jgi:hypothetical protein